MKQLFSLLHSLCVICDSPTDSTFPLCQYCIAELPYNHPACPQCALAVETLAVSHLCGLCEQCQQQPPIYQATIAPFHYKTSIRYLVIGLKFNKQLLYAHMLGTLLAKYIQNHYSATDLPDFLLPVPLHTRRLRARGFNQAVEICRVLSKRLAIPILLQSIKKAHATLPQSELSAQQRQSNLQHSFQLLTAPPKEARIAIVDDVITTGATMHEIAQLLHTANIDSVYAWACARTSISSI
jgi:ComF family protein